MAQNVDSNEDLRIRRTRKLLQQALMELVIEKGFADVTVRDLCERAMVNRSTFYRHYLDKFDLLEQYTNEVQAMTSMAEHDPQAKANPGVIKMLQHIEEHRDFYRVMLGPQGDQVFCQRLRENTSRRFRELLTAYASDLDPAGPPVEMRLCYIAHAGIGAIAWWVQEGQGITPEQLATWLSALNTTSAGLQIPTRRLDMPIDSRA